MSKDVLKLVIKMELSDLIFAQHCKGCYTMTIIMIILQWITVITSIVIKIINPDIYLRNNANTYKLSLANSSNSKLQYT